MTDDIRVRAYEQKDIFHMVRIWNEIVEEGEAFPQEECLTVPAGTAFFAAQSFCAVAEDADSGEILGLYILHPNNVGRCGHICNASFAVSAASRGRHIGERLVLDCCKQAGKLGFRLLQFNAVVAENTRARRLYERLGFHLVGTIPQGFRLKSGRYADICVYYKNV